MSTSAPDDQTADQAGSGSSPDGAESEDLLHDLANSTALLPQEAMPEGEELPEGAIALAVIEQDGTRYLPVFSSEEELRAAGADPSTALQMPIAQLAATWPADDLWLAVNPTNPDGLAIPPEVVRTLPALVHPEGEAEAAAEQDKAPQAAAEDTPSG